METNKKQTALDWLQEQIKDIQPYELACTIEQYIDEAKQMEREQMIELVQQLKDYTRESGKVLGHDEREASEFVDIFYNNIYGKNEK